MENKKILMLGWEYPPHITGGLAVACFEIAKNLAEQGYRILFVLPRLQGDEPEIPGVELVDIESGWMRLSEKQKEVLKTQFIETTRLVEKLSFSPYQSFGTAQTAQAIRSADNERTTVATSHSRQSFTVHGGYGAGIFEDIRNYAKFVSFLALDFQPDIIHSHDWMTFQAGRLAKESTKAPLILHIHATEYDRCGENGNRWIYDLERESINNADAVISVSQYTKDILIERYGVDPKKICPIHNGMSEIEVSDLWDDSKEEKEQLGDPIVLFLGRITYQKGPDYFVQAARKIVDKMPKVRFVMAGQGDMYHRMIEMAADLGLGKHFHYTGFLNRKETHRLYRMSRVYIMPSVSEPFGLTALEAVSHQIPIVVSKQSGVSEVIPNSIHVNFWDTEKLASSVISILKHDVLGKELSRNSNKDVSSITWGYTAHKISDLYSRIELTNLREHSL